MLKDLDYKIKKLRYLQKHKKISNISSFNQDLVDTVLRFNKEKKEIESKRRDKYFRDGIKSDLRSFWRWGRKGA